MAIKKWFKVPIRNVFLFAVICCALFMTSMAQADGGVINLPQTGQTTCYDTAWAEIACMGTGQDGDIRAGAAWPSPRFTFGTGAESECMIDNMTGLMWPKNGNLPNGGKIWYYAIDYSNNLTLCGHSDWRLPNINELESLINAGQADSAAWLNTQGFSNVQSKGYWSSTTKANSTLYVWEVDMRDGNVTPSNRTFDGNYVWPVRLGQSGSFGPSAIWRTGQTTSYLAGDDGDLKQGVPWPSPRFNDQGNGEVTDNLTGLVWTKDANAPGPSACSPATYKTWQGALDYVKCLNTQHYLGHSDWRLPNKKEPRSLVDYSRYTPALPSGHPFTNVRADDYWSSTTNTDYMVSAWNVSMWLGYVHSNDYKSKYGCVWPVRLGQTWPFYNLVISKSGMGSGTVKSSPVGINCGSDCSENYTSGTSVVLDASPASGSTFSGWLGDCYGTPPTCAVVMDASKTVTAVFNSVGSNVQTFLIYKGWNLISVPIQPSNTAIGTVLNGISGSYNIVWAYMNGVWKLYDPSDVPGSTLTTMEAGTGYWIKMSSAKTLDVSGATAPASINLVSGWNLTGYNKTANANASTVLNSIAGKYSIVWAYINGVWKLYDPSDVPGSTLTEFLPGYGYWIKTTEAVTWSQ